MRFNFEIKCLQKKFLNRFLSFRTILMAIIHGIWQVSESILGHFGVCIQRAHAKQKLFQTSATLGSFVNHQWFELDPLMKPKHKTTRHIIHDSWRNEVLTNMVYRIAYCNILNGKKCRVSSLLTFKNAKTCWQYWKAR